MRKVAIFGKPGSGKSVLAKHLAEKTGIPLHPLDSIAFKANGEKVSRPIYDEKHLEILNSEDWIIDGLGPIDSFYQRLDAADTLIYIDLPYRTSYWFVTKRLLKGFFVKPEGWPEGSSILKGTRESYKILKLCPKFWNEEFLSQLKERSNDKSLHLIQSKSDLNHFIARTI